MSSIFISYSRKDIEFARKLTQAFENQDLDFWIDWEGISPTVDWWKEIEKGIEEADIFIFLISPDSTKSKICNQEIQHAVKNGKRLIPIVVRDIKGDEAPKELSHINWIFLRETDDFDPAFSKLMEAINTDYEWAQTHRQIQVKALEWDRSGHENSFLLRGKELQDAEFHLATNTSKHPYLTSLQGEYVLKSRQATDRQRRIVTITAIVGVAALAALAIFGFVQAGLATTNEKKAVSNASTAQAASTLAFNNAATAVANEQEAKKQTHFAVARQITAQAQVLFTDKQQTSVLLAIQSMHMHPSFEAAQILQTNTLAHPIASMTHDGGAFSVAFSPDGKYVVSEGCDQLLDKNNCVSYSARVWDTFTGREVSRMTHDDWVRSVDFSPDGKYIVSGSDDKTVRVWEAATGKEVSRMTHDDIVSSVAFSPNGMYVVSGSGDNTARVWDMFTGREVSRMSHDADVVSVAFSPNGNYVVSEDGIIIPRYSMGGGGGSSNTVRVWVFNTGQEIARMIYSGLIAFGDPMKSIAFSPDGRFVVSGGVNTARVWDTFTGREVSRMSHDNRVTSVAFSPDGNYIVSGSNDKTARVWEVDTGQEIARMTHNDIVTSVAFSPNGNYVVSGSHDQSARVWQVTTKKEIARMMHDDNVVSVAFSPDGKYVVSGGANTALVWIPNNAKEVARMMHFGSVDSVAFTPDGKYVISEGATTVNMWETTTGNEINIISAGRISSSHSAFAAFSPDWKYIVLGSCEQQDIRENALVLCLSGSARVLAVDSGNDVGRMKFDGDVTSAAFSPDWKYIVLGSCDKWDDTQSCISGSASVRETITGNEVIRIAHDNRVFSVAFSPDGKYVLSSGIRDKTFHVWEALTGKEISRMTHNEVVSYSIAFSPDGKYVVSNGCDKINKNITCISGFIRVWDPLTGKELTRIAHDERVVSVAFSPDGKYVVSGSDDKTARVWDAATGQEIARMTNDERVVSVAFSPDGKYVASGSVDKTARVWDVATGQEIARMTHDEGVVSVAFSPDGKYVVSGSYDKSARVWVYRPDDLITKACSRVTRNLTQAEWKQYIGDTLPYQAVCPNLPMEPE